MFKIKNVYLKEAAELLFNLTLKGKQSRHRTKLVNIMSDRLKEVEEQRVKLAKEYSYVDEKGNPKEENGRFQIEDHVGFQNEVEELFNEHLVVEGEDNRIMLQTVADALLKTDEEFSGQEAQVYDYLCQQFEDAK
ncbi:hypothetical protein SAMN05421676_1122 [Salinibacillus kushneri]|uniref:DUF1617 family protein n=1 Tax=Salinibacillus kushneri TaxID=237682 RepID=A0A1I0IEY6_9BACI|nr:hypothetical protein [Salinibacillus kushneri]SET94567.1 hypothetical protein SAMN05421676_1122 [Salinibacillus kushneri]